MKQIKGACTNCGDPARIGAATIGRRASLGYCAACFRMWEANGGDDSGLQALDEKYRRVKSVTYATRELGRAKRGLV